ncbi:hypothetical protein CN213_16070 [Sinorhizobium meliloti]|uniref:flagellar FlbD family protein n=1 Tax=Rhizobium meliloti TaxID=382 RepID=UPI000FDB4FC8|nr:flagellar FlbD family protein [Sinorhizobium meliloti]RVH56262.1 hypothetical protein CN213_16070 [Sinorhizobium meliloti]
MALTTFKTGDDYGHQQVAINPDHVVSVEPRGDWVIIRTSASSGDAYQVMESFDNVVKKINRYRRQP